MTEKEIMTDTIKYTHMVLSSLPPESDVEGSPDSTPAFPAQAILKGKERSAVILIPILIHVFKFIYHLIESEDLSYNKIPQFTLVHCFY